MTTPFKDWSFTNASVLTHPVIRGDYAELQYRTAKLIYDSAPTANRLFSQITGFLQEDDIVQVPACIILPAGITFEEQNLSGKVDDYRYSFRVCIALKHPNPVVLFQLVSSYSEIVRAALLKPANGDVPANGVVIFDSVTGHYSTVLESEPIEPIAELRNGVLVFSSGLNIVYGVWTQR